MTQKEQIEVLEQENASLKEQLGTAKELAKTQQEEIESLKASMSAANSGRHFTTQVEGYIVTIKAPKLKTRNGEFEMVTETVGEDGKVTKTENKDAIREYLKLNGFRSTIAVTVEKTTAE